MYSDMFYQGKEIQRVQHIDYVAGLMILTMVVEHLTVFCRLYESIGYYVIHPTSYFMTWFFFKSGMLIKTDQTLLCSVEKGFYKLLVPFMVFSIIDLIVNFSSGIPEGITPYIVLAFLNHHECLWGGVSLWFLPTLFACKCIMTLIVNLHNKLAVTFSLVLWIMIYVAVSLKLEDRAIWIYNIPLGMVFMHIGYLLKDIQYNKICKYGSLLLFVPLFFFKTTIDVIQGVMLPMLPAFLYSIAGCVLLHNVFRNKNIGRMKFLGWIGENAMAVYLLHWPILSLLTQGIGVDSIGKVILITLCFSSLCYVLIPLLVRIFNKYKITWILGQ